MHAIPAFERESYQTELETVVIQGGCEGTRPFAVLEDTILFPEGGGQPADRGFLDAVSVLDVQKRDGEIRHYLASPLPPGPVTVRLDWVRRYDHMQQHTGQHLLTAVAQERFGWETTAFHLGETRCDIELAIDSIPVEAMERLEEAVATEIRAARPVSARQVSPEAYARLAVRSRGLPEGHRGDVRLVEIAGLDLNTCGGTHVRTIAELEMVKLLGVESIRGGTRLFFVVGGRVRRRMGEQERRNALMRTLLGVPDEELVSGLEAKLERLKAAERRGRALEEEMILAAAETLVMRPERLVERHFEGMDAGFIQRVARHVVNLAPSKIVFLTANQGTSAAFILGAGPKSDFEVAPAGTEVAGLLEAKGGGAKAFFQGKTASLGNRGAAFARLQALV